MGIFSRQPKKGSQRAKRDQTLAHFTNFAQTRKGVEAYFEQAGARDPMSLLLVAHDGEWTRRQVPDAQSAAKIADSLKIPFYEVIRTGYPQRMREWSARNK